MKKTGFRLILLTVMLAAAILVSLCFGRYPLSIGDIAGILAKTGEDRQAASVFWEIRLPRLLFSAAAGAALSVSGLVFQNMFQNPLVSPDVLGVSGGASAGAVIGILAGFTAAQIRLVSLAAGIVTVCLTMGLARLIGNRKQISLILAGVVMGALADAVIMALKYLADPDRQLPVIDYWLMGSFQNAFREDLIQLLAIVLPVFAVLGALRWKLQMMCLGDTEAESLGVNVRLLRLVGILGATLLTAAVVSKTGVVAWTGLIVPHMVRFAFGDSMKENFAECILAGGTFMVCADTAARSLTAAEIPVSILTSLAGTVFLVGILIKRRLHEAG